MSYGFGDWVLVKFPQDEAGWNRKLSRPWHGPYWIVDRRDRDVTVVKVYALQDGQIQVHQSRVSLCSPGFPAGFFWYGGKRSNPGRPPKVGGQTTTRCYPNWRPNARSTIINGCWPSTTLVSWRWTLMRGVSLVPPLMLLRTMCPRRLFWVREGSQLRERTRPSVDCETGLSWLLPPAWCFWARVELPRGESDVADTRRTLNYEAILISVWCNVR